MFWWLYYTTASVANYTEEPLILWLQGGPGASSTGYGNFEEIGPLDVNLSHRNHTWVNSFHHLNYNHHKTYSKNHVYPDFCFLDIYLVIFFLG